MASSSGCAIKSTTRFPLSVGKDWVIMAVYIQNPKMTTGMAAKLYHSISKDYIEIFEMKAEQLD